MRYTCPLCHQPVSVSVYNRITGIWEEKKKLLRQMRDERKRQLERFRREKAELRQQASAFNRRKKEIIEQAIQRKTSRLQRKLELSELKEQKLADRYDRRIERIQAASKERAQRLAKIQLLKYKREMRPSIQAKIKAERTKAVEKERQKNAKLQRSVQSALKQMQMKESQLSDYRRQIADLKRQVQRQTTPQIEGLLYEKNLVKELRRRFPKDNIEHKGKGGDILHYVLEEDGRQVGMIVYECKRVKHYNSKHVTQTLLAKEQRRADFAILVTNAMRRNTFGFFTEKEVLVVHATGVLSLASVLRRQIAHISSMKLGQLEREKAVRMTLDYLEGPEFTNSLEAIIGETINLHKELVDEVKKHVSTWRRRYKSYSRIHDQAFDVRSTTRAMLAGEEKQKETERPSFPALVKLPEMDREEVMEVGVMKRD